MTLQGKRLDDISERELQALITDRVPEGRALDYKRDLPGGGEGAKKEFLADVTSFANAAGGHLVYGMAEAGGLPTTLVGLPGIDVDAAILRLDQLVAVGIAPRIPGLALRAVPLATGGAAIVVAIPRSWARPHQVTYQGSGRFFARNSGGKYLLDVQELRTLFALADTVGERVRRFRADRLAQIVADETPLPLSAGGRVVLHLIPVGAFGAGVRIDLGRLVERSGQGLFPLGATGFNQHFNFDGVVTYVGSPEGGGVPSYLQLFRDGAVEAVAATLVADGQIAGEALERQLISRLGDYLAVQAELALAPPLVVSLTLLGVAGHELRVDPARFGYPHHARRIDRDLLACPELLVEDLAVDPATILRPALDALWNAAGWPRAESYDAAGRWLGGP